MKKDILVVTTNEAPGYEIEQVYGYISVNYVSGADFIKDFLAGFTSFFGGISESYTDEITELKEEARIALEKKARALNMNCILGVKIDLDPIFSDKYSMFMVSATGTAVRLKGYSNNSEIDTLKLEVTKELEKMYTVKINDEINYDFTKVSKRKFEDSLYGLSDEEIKKVIDNILKVYKESYTVAALSENRAKIEILSNFIITNNLTWVIQYLHTDIDKAKALLIRDMRMINYNSILDGFKSKKDIEYLFITLSTKPTFVSEEQFNSLVNLIDYLKENYSENVETREIGSFKKRTVWVCKKCKGNVEMDIESCPNCEINKMGLKTGLKAKEKINNLINIKEALSKVYVR